MGETKLFKAAESAAAVAAVKAKPAGKSKAKAKGKAKAGSNYSVASSQSCDRSDHSPLAGRRLQGQSPHARCQASSAVSPCILGR